MLSIVFEVNPIAVQSILIAKSVGVELLLYQ